MLESKQEIRTFAKDIILKECKAIENLIEYVDEDFAKIALIIAKSKGRVVVTGIGKSAIICNKIVATLNSTGTPALFMHAADAIHGDLGMIQNGDTVICISKSGNTPEIKVLIPLIRNIGKDNIIIGMVGNLDSFLATSSDYIINTFVTKEACPNNLAPTSSTTAQLVMGDALAMTLIQIRGFSSDDFAKVHPGGSLGKRLYTRVEDILSKDMTPMVSSEATIEQVIIEISSKMMGATAVVDKGILVGIITDGDLRRMLQSNKNIPSLSAGDIMSKKPKTIELTELAVKAFSMMEANKITQLVVCNENGEYRGIIHLHDILREGVV